MRESLSDAEMRYIVPLVRAAMKARGLTARALAKMSGYAGRTIRYLITYGAGMPKKTVNEICSALAIDLETVIKSMPREEGYATQPRHFVNCGHYSKQTHGHHVGRYTKVRVAYANSSAIKCYRTDISWHDELSILHFEESERGDDYGQKGCIYICPGSAHLSLLTNDENGWIRAIIVSQLVYNTTIMRGLILSQYHVGGPSYAPICAPIVYLKQSDDETAPPYGELSTDSEYYPKYMGLIHETMNKSFARMALPILAPPPRIGVGGSDNSG